MKYPVDCDTPRRMTEYLYRAQELLRKLHNVFVVWRETGLTNTQYNKLPQKIKDKYLYTQKISMETWKKFQDEDFMPKSRNINNEIGKQRDSLKKSTRWAIDVGAVEGFYS